MHAISTLSYLMRLDLLSLTLDRLTFKALKMSQIT